VLQKAVKALEIGKLRLSGNLTAEEGAQAKGQKGKTMKNLVIQ